MNPNVRQSLGMNQPDFGKRLRNIILTGGALVGALVVVTGPIAAGGKALDTRYVHQAGYVVDRKFDSLTHKQEIDSMFRILRDVSVSQSRTDSTLRCFRKRKPSWCD